MLKYSYSQTTGEPAPGSVFRGKSNREVPQPEGVLTKRQRQATILRGQGLNQYKIAQAMGIGVDAVKKLLQKARQKEVFCFQCDRCQNEVETETLTGTCPHCGSQFELHWQAEYKGKKASLTNKRVD